MELKNKEDQRRSEKAVVVTQRMQRDEKMAAAESENTVFPDAPGRFIVLKCLHFLLLNYTNAAKYIEFLSLTDATNDGIFV